MQNESLETLQKHNQQLSQEVDRLNSIITLLKRAQFGSKSERVITTPPEQLIFNEFEKEASSFDLPVPTQRVSYDRKKGRCKKKPFPDNIPREELVIDLKEAEKICPHDGTRLKEIGEERTEKFITTPARMSVSIEIKKKYACPCCQTYLVQPKVSSLLPGTIATPELLAFITYSKFFQGLPLYRLEEQFKLHHVEISRGSMARWLVQITPKLIPLYNLLQDKMFESGYMAIDATNVQVLKEKGRTAQSKSFMWARGSPEKGIVLFDYDPSGGGKIAKNLVLEFKGALQADAHRGYGALDRIDLLLLGCMMHLRRRFEEAWVVSGKKPGLAADGLAMMRWIYEKEEKYKASGLTPIERKSIRDREIKPSLATMREWAVANAIIVPKKSPVGNALHYLINEYDELVAFLANGRYEIDNGWIERTIRKFAIGRNNWLFCDTVDGAQASSLLYSLTITAKLNGHDPFRALAEIFRKLPDARTLEDYEALAELLLSPSSDISCRKKG